MEGSYPLHCKKQTVGSVELQKTGMFLRIVCCGCAPDDQRYRLVLHSKAGSTDLGLWSFNGLAGKIIAQLPVKQAGEPPFRFCLESEHTQQFVAIYTDRPFSALSKLENARLAVNGGQTGVLFTG